MAGIGFTLQRLTRRNDLIGFAQGYGVAALISTGPWLLTVVAIAAIGLVQLPVLGSVTVNTFRAVLIYNFAFSLVLSGPVVLAGTRYLADSIYERNVAGAPTMLAASLTFVWTVGGIGAGCFYWLAADLTQAERICALANFQIVSALWVTTTFLTALKDYYTYVLVFLLGAVTGCLAAIVGGLHFGAAGMLGGLTIGFGLIVFVMLGRVLTEFPFPFGDPRPFLRHAWRHGDLAISGLAYNAAIWADKWVMWTVPEREIIADAIVTYPNYDTAMFLSYLSVVPAMSIFLLASETRFFEEYQRFYKRIGDHADLSEIRCNQRRIAETVGESARNLLVLQGAISVCCILLASQIVVGLGGTYSQIGIFRLGVLGAFFHVLYLFTTILLSYFDLRRATMELHLFFLLTNLAASVVSREMGFAWFGFGYLAAAIASMTLGVFVLMAVMQRLPFLAFSRQNYSIVRLLSPAGL